VDQYEAELNQSAAPAHDDEHDAAVRTDFAFLLLLMHLTHVQEDTLYLQAELGLVDNIEIQVSPNVQAPVLTRALLPENLHRSRAVR
jgi:hypothetical protein